MNRADGIVSQPLSSDRNLGRGIEGLGGALHRIPGTVHLILASACLSVSWSFWFDIFFSGNNIGPEAAATLSQSLTVLTALELLNLQENCIGSAGARALGPAINALANLTDLNLECRAIRSSGSHVKSVVFCLQTIKSEAMVLWRSPETCEHCLYFTRSTWDVDYVA